MDTQRLEAIKARAIAMRRVQLLKETDHWSSEVFLAQEDFDIHAVDDIIWLLKELAKATK